jgi:predicted anti-sigma-YlaC factor YlaD
MALAMLHPTRACDQARSFVSLRLDDELSELEHALLDAHLGGCSACRVFAAEVEAMTGELRAARLEQPERPVSLPLTRRQGYLRGLQTAAAGAVAAVAVVAGVVGITPAVVGGPSAHEGTTSFVEPVSPRKELQLYDSGEPTEGPSGIDIPN